MSRRERERRERDRGDRRPERERERGERVERERGERERERGERGERERERERDRGERERPTRDKERRGDKSRERERERDKKSERRRRSGDRHNKEDSESPLRVPERRRKSYWDQMIVDEVAVVVPPPQPPQLNPQLQRQQKRLYVGNLPASVQEIELMEFFNTAMLNANLVTTPGSPCVSATINREKAYAFIEFRTVEETTSGMSLDGIMLQGQVLRVRRPKDYQPNASELSFLGAPSSPSSDSGSSVLAANLNIVSTNVTDTPYKIFIGSIPTHLNEGDVKKLLSMFGQLKSFNLVRDSITGLSKGYAFCEYADPNITDTACASLNGMAIGDKNLIVQRASVNRKENEMDKTSVGPINYRAANMLTLSTPAAQLLATAVKNATADPTRILVLMNILNMFEFPGDHEESEYQEFLDDVREECERYGKVLRILVPRPTTKQKNHTVEHFDASEYNSQEEDPEESKSEDEEPPPPGCGKVFVEYEKIDHAKRAQTALSGRRYDGRMVITSFHPEEKWKEGILEPDEIEPEYYLPLLPAQKINATY